MTEFLTEPFCWIGQPLMARTWSTLARYCKCVGKSTLDSSQHQQNNISTVCLQEPKRTLLEYVLECLV